MNSRFYYICLLTDMELTDQQIECIELVKKGMNIFITGVAGSSKSYTLRYIINMLINSDVTASTGVAAVNIGGMTIHSWSGIGLGNDDPDILVKKIRRNKDALSRWKNCKVLIIDEVSMISGDLFDKLDYIGRNIRGRISRSFGGIQLILTGDFLQLPPISKDEEEVKYCFEAKTWSSTIDRIVNLTHIFRQSNKEFTDALSSIRRGVIDDSVIATLTPCINRVIDGRSIKLLPLRREVDTINLHELSKIKSVPHEYTAEDTYIDKKYSDIFNGSIVPYQIVLKEGASVMLIKNIDVTHGLYNGLTGTITGFDDYMPVVKFNNGLERTVLPHEWNIKIKVDTDKGIIDKTVASRVMIPLILGYAITIHKSQGMTITKGEVNISNCFAESQVYVALSRFTSLESLSIIGDLDLSSVKVSDKALKFYGY